MNSLTRGKRINYVCGDVVNSETGSKYIRELPKTRSGDRRAVILCGGCGRKYETTLSGVRKGRLCPSCGSKKAAEYFKEHFKIGDIINQETKTIYLGESDKSSKNHRMIKAKCGYCGEVYEVRLDAAKKGFKCSKCKAERHTKYFVGDIIKYGNLSFYFKEEIISTDKKRKGVFYQIDKDGKQISQEFIATPTNVAKGYSFGGVSQSKSEKQFEACLKDMKIRYKSQYSFKNLFSASDKNPLRFDFYIEINGKKYLVELDGEQHYMPIDFFGGEEYFNKVKKYDSLKNNYAKQMGYTLIRIPYWDFDKINIGFIKKLLEINEEV